MTQRSGADGGWARRKVNIWSIGIGPDRAAEDGGGGGVSGGDDGDGWYYLHTAV